MKSALLFISFSLSLSATAAEWKVIAETTDCPERVRVLASEGEKHVLVEKEGKRQRLESENGKAYRSDRGTTMSFATDTRNKTLGDLPTYEFNLPATFESNPPRIHIFYSGVKHDCRMLYK
jgi:hypothetical protein